MVERVSKQLPLVQMIGGFCYRNIGILWSFLPGKNKNRWKLVNSFVKYC